jgi:3',5'-cyclic AMP phosphodiesterase CpdA
VALPMHMILVSDLHLRDPEVSADAAAHAAQVGGLLERAVARFPDPVCCVIAGDLADAGEPGAYAWLKRKLESLRCPTVPMLGNHDDRGAFRQVFGAEGSDGGFLQSTGTLDGLRLVFLDTLSPGSDAGELCHVRLDWLDRTLADGGDTCLFMHHPPCDIGDPVLDPIKLSNADELAALLRRHGNVRQIFFGHVHRTIFLTWNGIACAGIGSLGDAGQAVGGLLAQGPEGLVLTVRPLAT